MSYKSQTNEYKKQQWAEGVEDLRIGLDSFLAQRVSKARAQAQATRSKDRDSYNAYAMSRYYANRDKVRAQRAEKYAANPEPVRQAQHEYYKNNKEKFKARATKRHEQGADDWHNALDTPAAREWFYKNVAQDFHYPARTRTIFAEGEEELVRHMELTLKALKLTLDHIHPQALGGTHNASNIQGLTKSNNSSKGDRLDWEGKVDCPNHVLVTLAGQRLKHDQKLWSQCPQQDLRLAA